MLLALLGGEVYTNDAAWLLTHICADGMVDLRVLHKATILEILAQKVQSRALDLAIACLAANLLLETTTVGLEILAQSVIKRLFEDEQRDSETEIIAF